MFRVAHSLDDVQMLRAWLVTQGYRIADLKIFCPNRPEVERPNKNVCSFSAIMPPDVFAEKTSIFEAMSFPWRLIYRKAALRHGLQFSLSVKLEVVGVYATVDTES